MKSEQRSFTHYIEIPVKVHYTFSPAEAPTLTYPGCEADISVDLVSLEDMDDLYVDPETLEELCWEDWKAGG